MQKFNKSMQKKSLKSKILLYFILFTTIPLIIGSSVILYQMYKSKKESIFHKHYQILKQVEQESDNIIINIEDIAQYVKNKYPIKKSKLIDALPQLQKNISTILILDNNGILKDFGSNIKINIFKGYDYSNTKYFLAIKNGLENYWSEVYLSQATFSPAISYTIRIDKDNIAVLIIDLNSLNTFAKKFTSIDNTSMIRITDKNGIFLAHPDKPKFISQRKNIFDSSLYQDFLSKNHTYKQIRFINKSGIDTIGIYSVSEKLGWYIIVKESYNFLFETFNTLMWFIVLFIVILITISIYFSIKLSKSILIPLDIINSNIDDIAHGKHINNLNKKTNYVELDKLRSNILIMQNKIINREKQNRQKDKLLAQQSKMASMGEMLENIAHQWRQPLSIISTASSGIKMQKEFGVSSEKQEMEILDTITITAEHLSKTIDDFRDFFKPNKDKKLFNIKEVYKRSLNLLESKFKNRNIEVIENINDIELYGLDSELIQVIMNILNNANDILEAKNHNQKKLIFVDIDIQDNNAILRIKDNGGGISPDIVDMIFDPYFTTKHKSQGTGIGLYMTEEMIVKHMHGSINVENKEFIYQNESYRGACFTVTLPIIKKQKKGQLL